MWLFQASEGKLAQWLSHWLLLFSSFNGWRFLQPRVSLSKQFLQLGYTPTKLMDSGVASRGGCPWVAWQPLTEYQHLPLVENQQDQQMRSFLGFCQPCRRKQLNRYNECSSWYFPMLNGVTTRKKKIHVMWVRLRQLRHYFWKIWLSLSILP